MCNCRLVKLIQSEIVYRSFGSREYTSIIDEFNDTINNLIINKKHLNPKLDSITSVHVTDRYEILVAAISYDAEEGTIIEK